MNVVGYHITDEGLVVDSYGRVPFGTTPVEFLLRPQPDTIRMIYDLGYSIGGVVTLFGKTTDDLGDGAAKLTKLPYHLKYIPKKFFSIKRVGAFVYFADSSQYVGYPESDLSLGPLVLATRAKEVGERVYQILKELGIDATSLTSPVRAYEKTQLSWLYNEKKKASDTVKSSIIDGIGLGIYGDNWSKFSEKMVGGVRR